MQVIPTGLPSVYILEPKVFGDSRGWFMETWSERDLERAGLHYRFVQDNQSFSAQKGVLRGIHFQKGDAAQAKIVRCNRGAVLDKADRFYTPEADRGIRWNDPEIGIEWGCENPVLSEKDRNAPSLSESDVDFIYE